MPRLRLRHQLTAVLALVALLLQGSWAFAGTTGRLQGRVVVTGSTTGVANARVTATSPSQTASTTTDAQGNFAFVSLAPDTYTISVEKQGFEPASVAGISVLADQTQTLSLNTRQQLQTIGRVTSRAASDIVRPGTTSDVYSVTPTIQAAAAPLGGGGSINQAYSGIASVPGVYIPQGQSGWAQSVYVRGGNYTQLGYEFDGVPIQRAFDQYPATNVSALGQQELQVYTGAQPVNGQSDGLAGYINQVIKNGTYPGFANLDLGIGSPTFYHKVQFEIGGATPNRNFSYYLGTAGYDQSLRYGDQFNGAPLDQTWSLNPYNFIAANCGAGNATIGCYSNGAGLLGAPLGPNGWALGPFSYNFQSRLIDRETVANLHFGIPHHKDGGKDDIQLLYDNSWLRTIYGTSLADWTYAATDVQNGTATINGVSYPNCGNVPNPATAGPGGTPCAVIGGVGFNYVNPTLYTGPIGTKLSPANLSQVTQYRAPNSAPNQQPVTGGPINPTQPDTYDNNAAIVKLQYQKNFGSNAYFRIYGYSFFSDWLQNGANSLIQNYTGGVSPDYELISHTRGTAFDFADQINPKHLLDFSGGYTFASTIRWNNSYYAPATATAVLVDSTNPTNGLCYNTNPVSVAANGGNPVPIYCGSGSVAQYRIPGVGGDASLGLNPGKHKYTYTDPTTGKKVTGTYTDPTLTAASGMTCGGGPCEYFTVQSGADGRYNTVAPVFTNVALQDTFKPFDRLVLNLGLKYEDFRYDLPSTVTANGPFPQAGTGAAARTLFQNSWNAFNCYDPAHISLVSVTTPNSCASQGLQQGAFSNLSPTSQDYHAWEPRLGFTYTVDPLTVLRGSYGKYEQPASSAFQQYDSANYNLAAANAVFYTAGFTTPNHLIYPEESYNTDFSVEHQFKGTDLSMKLTPFLRQTKNQIFNVLLDPKTNFVSGINVGNETADGVEFLLRKGDFNRNGWAAQLAYTFTYATVKFNTLQNGHTVVDGVNTSIAGYNAYTSYCFSHTTDARCKNPDGSVATTSAGAAPGNPTGGAPCYAPDGTPDATCAAGSIANPYWNAPVQALLNPNDQYIAYNQLPGTGLSSVASSYVVPHIATLLVNYKHDRFTVTPSLQFAAGGRYGSPVNGIGIDPASGCSALAGATVAGDPRYQYGAAGGAPYDAQTCTGAIVAPDPYTKQFDNFGVFTEPSQLALHMQVGYDVSSRLHLQLTAANIFVRCFGGSQVPWQQNGNIGCWYGTPLQYVGNFYNPGNSIQTFQAYPYAPQFGSVFQQIYGAQTNPFQLFLSAQIKL